MQVARFYPDSFSQVILTGFSDNTTNSAQFSSSLDLLPASFAAPQRYRNLSSGHLIPSTKYGVQYAFLHYPNFSPAILEQAFDTIETDCWRNALGRTTRWPSF